MGCIMRDADSPGEGGAAVSEQEVERLRRAVKRLMDGQQEALDAIGQLLEGRDTLTEEALVDLEDILEGTSEDARSILEADEGGEV
jgi:hypothetical protein